jgi:ATP10 protein
MKTIVRILALSSALTLFLSAQTGQTLPHLEGTTLNDQKVVLPDPSHYRTMILVFGFTHKSSEQADAWGKRLAKDYASRPEVAYFEIPVLQSAPGFVRPMIVHGMKKGTPAAEQGHVLIIDKHEDELKKLVGYEEQDDAYVVVASSEGKVVWQTHGAISDEKYAGLEESVSGAKPAATDQNN